MAWHSSRRSQARRSAPSSRGSCRVATTCSMSQPVSSSAGPTSSSMAKKLGAAVLHHSLHPARHGHDREPLALLLLVTLKQHCQAQERAVDVAHCSHIEPYVLARLRRLAERPAQHREICARPCSLKVDDVEARLFPR